jgi:hypothetical protein
VAKRGESSKHYESAEDEATEAGSMISKNYDIDMKENEGWGVGMEFYISRKRRRGRARALPDAAVAKPGGANTTLQIIIIIIGS